MLESLNIIQTVRNAFSKPDTNADDTIIIPPIDLRQGVKIITDKHIRGLYRKGWIKKTRTQPITEIVLHGTGGGTTIETMLKWMAGGERAKEYLKGIALFHYLIGREGEIVEVLDPNYWVYHSGSGRHDKQTIGIELMNPSKLNDAEYTDKQYQALEKLIFDHLMPSYSSITRITSHRYNKIVYSHDYNKYCPGSGFKWAWLTDQLFTRGISYKTDGNLHIITEG